MSDITIFTTPTCGFCHMAKQYFKSHKLSYSEKDITRDTAAQMWVLDKTGQLAVPVIDIDGTIILGFDRPNIDAALRQKQLV